MNSIDDVIIGPGKSIPWIQVDPNDKGLFDIDELLMPTWAYWSRLESECLHECCGIHAFNFLPENISKAVEDLDLPNLINMMTLLKTQLESSSKQIFISDKFNNLFAKELFITLLDHNISTIVNITK